MICIKSGPLVLLQDSPIHSDNRHDTHLVDTRYTFGRSRSYVSFLITGKIRRAKKCFEEEGLILVHC